MITEAQIQAVVQRIVEGYAPDRIILFGSYAYGTPTENSDLDLLVVKAGDVRRKIERILEISHFARSGPDVPAMDILVLNSTEEERARQIRFIVEHKALRDGRELYAAA